MEIKPALEAKLVEEFVAAMLGKLEIVKAALSIYPKAKDIPGPHGIPLIEHASAGGEGAKAVVEFLDSLE